MVKQQRRPGAARGAVLGGLAAVVAAALAMAALATAQTSDKPSNTSPPTINGTASQGSTLTAMAGNWSGSPAPTFQYQWRRCDANGGSCSDISGAIQQTYTLAPVDNGNTLRVRVEATNASGSATATSVPTAVVAATPVPPVTGCPTPAAGASSVDVGGVGSPARLQIAGFQPTPGIVSGSMQSFSVSVHVTDTCGQSVSGANVFATAVPYNQVTVPAETATDATGWVKLTFYRRAGFPAARNQRLMVMFIRASKPGENTLAGVSTRRLVSFPVDLKV